MVAIIIAAILIILGVIGCFVAKIPGPLVAWVGLVVLTLSTSLPIDWWILWIILPVIIILSMIFTSKYAPKIASKVSEFGKGGKWGTFAGSMLAVLMALCNMNFIAVIVCLLIFPYLFAFLFEFLSVKNGGVAAKRAGGSYVLYLMTTLVKLLIVYFCFKLAFNF